MLVFTREVVKITGNFSLQRDVRQSLCKLLLEDEVRHRTGGTSSESGISSDKH